MNPITENRARRLKKWRREIDRIDNRLLQLLNQRAGIACELAVVKVADGLPAYDGRRERQVINRVRAANRGPLSGQSVANVFRRVILETRRLGIEAMRQERKKSRLRRRTKRAHTGETTWAAVRPGKEQHNGH